MDESSRRLLERIAESLERSEERQEKRIRLLSESVDLQRASRNENSEIADAIKLTALPTGWRCWVEGEQLYVQRPDGEDVRIAMKGAP